MHFLVFFAKEDKIINVVAIDQIVYGEFPNPKEDLVLFDTLLRTMVHGPCRGYNPNSTCIKDGSFSKSFSKTFHELTSIDVMHIHCIKEETTLIEAMKYMAFWLIIEMFYLTIQHMVVTSTLKFVLQFVL